MSERPAIRESISHSYAPIPATNIGPLHVAWGSRTYIMAVANLTPDSFSGDGLMANGAASTDLLDRVEQFARDAVRDGAAAAERPHLAVEEELDGFERRSLRPPLLRRQGEGGGVPVAQARGPLPPVPPGQGRGCA